MKKFRFFPLPLLLAFCLLSCEEMDQAGYESFSYAKNNDGLVFYEQYNEFQENAFVKVSEAPVSTFSIDADGGSYSNTRRFLHSGLLPPAAAIRTEELINYFSYDYPEPTGPHPVSVHGEVSACPWNAEHKLVRIGLKGMTIGKDELPAANFVLLVDVSGSMSAEDKLPLLKAGLVNFVKSMRDNDKLAIVTYAGSSRVALPSTSGKEKAKIIDKLKALGAGGSTAGAEGIATAYKIAQENYIEGGNNRIILGTDGDFNVGISSQTELINLIEKKREEEKIFLTVIGYGTGNLNEAMMEQVANHGNGNYEYIDNLQQSDKVFLEEYGKFYSVAKDVKVQVEFLPEMVEEYRLIGYENRLLANEDFEDDKKDAGEIGAGQCVTALYEIKPARTTKPAARTLPTFKIDFRYKLPGEKFSVPLSLEIFDQNKPFGSASEDMRFAVSVAGFGMLLRDSPYKGELTYGEIYTWAENAKNYDPYKYREGFLDLIDLAKDLNL